MNSILPLSKCQVVALNQNVELDTNKAEKQEYGDEVDLERGKLDCIVGSSVVETTIYGLAYQAHTQTVNSNTLY